MQAKRSLPAIFIISGFILLGTIVVFQGPIKEFLSYKFEIFKITFDNFFYQGTPGERRRAPRSLIIKQDYLKMYVGQPFRNFSDAEWKNFWKLVYGVYPKQPVEKAGLPNRMRQLTEEEIEQELMDRYPQPFANFREKHWSIFFQILFSRD